MNEKNDNAITKILESSNIQEIASINNFERIDRNRLSQKEKDKNMMNILSPMEINCEHLNKAMKNKRTSSIKRRKKNASVEDKPSEIYTVSLPTDNNTSSKRTQPQENSDPKTVMNILSKNGEKKNKNKQIINQQNLYNIPINNVIQRNNLNPSELSKFDITSGILQNFGGESTFPSEPQKKTTPLSLFNKEGAIIKQMVVKYLKQTKIFNQYFNSRKNEISEHDSYACSSHSDITSSSTSTSTTTSSNSCDNIPTRKNKRKHTSSKNDTFLGNLKYSQENSSEEDDDDEKIVVKESSEEHQLSSVATDNQNIDKNSIEIPILKDNSLSIKKKFDVLATRNVNSLTEEEFVFIYQNCCFPCLICSELNELEPNSLAREILNEVMNDPKMGSYDKAYQVYKKRKIMEKEFIKNRKVNFRHWSLLEIYCHFNCNCDTKDFEIIKSYLLKNGLTLCKEASENFFNVNEDGIKEINKSYAPLHIKTMDSLLKLTMNKNYNSSQPNSSQPTTTTNSIFPKNKIQGYKKLFSDSNNTNNNNKNSSKEKKSLSNPNPGKRNSNIYVDKSDQNGLLFGEDIFFDKDTLNN